MAAPANVAPTATFAVDAGAPEEDMVMGKAPIDPKVSLGRDFRGRIRLLAEGQGRRVNVRYLSKGAQARIQVDTTPAGQSRNFDAVLNQDRASIVLPERRAYYEKKLGPVTGKPEPDAKIEKTSETRRVSDLTCEVWRAQEAGKRVEACVVGLPGNFDIDSFENLSGLNVPGWLRKFAKDGFMPVTAQVRSEAGRELYKLELLEFSPSGVQDEEFTIPEGYQRIEEPQSRRPAAKQ